VFKVLAGLSYFGAISEIGHHRKEKAMTCLSSHVWTHRESRNAFRFDWPLMQTIRFLAFSGCVEWSFGLSLSFIESHRVSRLAWKFRLWTRLIWLNPARADELCLLDDLREDEPPASLNANLVFESSIDESSI
jgi:hypothetical protein